jgi:hypothetical protein
VRALRSGRERGRGRPLISSFSVAMAGLVYQPVDSALVNDLYILAIRI